MSHSKKSYAKNKSMQRYPLKKHIRNLAMMSLGSLICTAGYCIFITPNNLLAGGVWGAADILTHFAPIIPMAVYVALFNIPLLIWGWNKLNTRFALYTVYTVILQSVLLLFLPDLLPVYNNDLLLSCLFGGVLIGAGGGIVVRYHGSGGGTDIVGIILKSKYDVSVGTISLSVNVLVVAVAGIIFGFEPAMYTMVELFVISSVFTQVLEGMMRKRNMTIVTEKGQLLTERLLYELGRGVTVIHGEGGFTHRPKQVLILVCSRFEMAAVKEIIKDTDPRAFVCVNQTYEVLGMFAKKAEVNQALQQLQEQQEAEQAEIEAAEAQVAVVEEE